MHDKTAVACFILFGTLLSGYFLWVYESTLKELLALVTFVPVICAMSGNVGVQSTSIVIRDWRPEE